MKSFIKYSLRLSLLTVAVSSPTAANWPGWRGPEGTGVSPEKNLPTQWNSKEGVRWHVDLPSPGNSSPIIWGNRVFVTQALKDENRRTVMCFDRADGKLLWQSGTTYAEKESTQENNPFCAGTPATDGERVYTCFGSAGVFAYDFTGKELWHRELGKIEHMFGNAVSPVLYGDLCILNYGPDEKSRLVALSKKTGEIVWEVQPPQVDPDENPPMRFGGPGGPGGRGPGGPDGGPGARGPGGPAQAGPDGGRPPGGPGGPPPAGRGGRGGGGGSWSTPIVIKAGGHDELVVNFPNRLAAYNPTTGKQLWLSKGIGGSIHATPAWGDGALVAMSSGPGGGNAIAVKPGGTGDVTESQRIWRLERVKSNMGSGVIYEGHFYSVSQDGIAACLDLKDGSMVWEERLKGPGTRGSSWSSTLLSDGKIYVPNQSGDVFVLRASPKFEVLATNSVGESSNASLAASDGQVFMRTDKGLWCFGVASK